MSDYCKWLTSALDLSKKLNCHLPFLHVHSYLHLAQSLRQIWCIVDTSNGCQQDLLNGMSSTTFNIDHEMLKQSQHTFWICCNWNWYMQKRTDLWVAVSLRSLWQRILIWGIQGCRWLFLRNSLWCWKQPIAGVWLVNIAFWERCFVSCGNHNFSDTCQRWTLWTSDGNFWG